VSNFVASGSSCRQTNTAAWTATDACGNSSSRSQTIILVDTTAPTVTTPAGADTTNQCGTALSFSAPVFADSCSSLSVVSNFVASGSSCRQTNTATWTATDACGNSASRSQTIILVDTTAPTVTTPPGNDATNQCGTALSFSAPVFADSCSSLSVVSNFVASGSSCRQTNTATWTATDACGNSSSRSQTIILVDTTVPTVTTPAGADTTNQCGTALSFSAPVFADSCSSVSVVSNFVASGSSCRQTNTATWTATDACGNSSSRSQTIILVDTTAPTVTTPAGADTTNQCGTALSFSAPVFADSCSSVSVVSNFVASGSSCRQTNTATWTATDACGNSTSRSQTIILVDTTAPTVTTPAGADTTNQCGTALSFSAPVFADSCSSVSVVSNFVASGSSCRQTNTATWTATDACGNSSSRSQTIILVDTTAPTVTTPAGADTTNQCGTALSFSAPVFADSCSSVSVVSNFVASGSSCRQTNTATWTATDACGNSTSRSQTIILVDTTAPTVTTPAGADTTNQCGTALSFSAPVFADSCSSVSVVSNFVASGSSCRQTNTATWTATDACGNSSSRSQTIILVDTTAPTVTTPPGNDATNQCGTALSFS